MTAKKASRPCLDDEIDAAALAIANDRLRRACDQINEVVKQSQQLPCLLGLVTQDQLLEGAAMPWDAVPRPGARQLAAWIAKDIRQRMVRSFVP